MFGAELQVSNACEPAPNIRFFVLLISEIHKMPATVKKIQIAKEHLALPLLAF
jgi:hypothetical protein